MGMSRPVYRSIGMAAPGLGRPSLGRAMPMGVDPFAQPKPVFRSISVPAGASHPMGLPEHDVTWRSLAVAPQKPSPFAYAAPGLKSAPPPAPSLSSAALVTPAPLLPPAPFALEKFTSFEVTQPSSSTTDAVVQQLRAAIAATGAQADYNPAKHKFKGISYCPGSFNAVRFTVRLYRTSNDADQRHVVEFQRREGCCMAWRGFYDSVLAQCGALNEDLAVTARGRAQKRGVRGYPAAADARPAAEAGGEAEGGFAGLGVLADMASCDFVESRLEACRSLALMTAKGPSARAVARHQRCRKATLEHLRSSDGNVQRCAVAAVANVLEAIGHASVSDDDRELFAQLRQDAVQPMVAAAAALTPPGSPPGSGHMAETQRHAVRGLAALARVDEDSAAAVAAAFALAPHAAEAMRRMAAPVVGGGGSGEWQKNCWAVQPSARGASDAAFVLQRCGM